MLRVVRTDCSDVIATDHDCCCKRSVMVTLSRVQGPSGKTNLVCLDVHVTAIVLNFL